MDLQESHFIPRSIYKILRSSDSENRVSVTVTGDRAWICDKQVTDYVFCKDCEDRFNRNGEGWVARNCARDESTFLLRDVLQTVTPIVLANDIQVYPSRLAPQIEPTKLVYFAASVFWRGSVHEWEAGGKKATLVSLGTKYQEEFRRYLLGQADFPANGVMMVCVPVGPKALMSFTFPGVQKFGTYHQFRFSIPGITFNMALGAGMPAEIRRMCTLRSPDNFIYSSPLVDLTHVETMNHLIKSAERLGKLRR
jgi:hypothetical protein